MSKSVLGGWFEAIIKILKCVELINGAQKNEKASFINITGDKGDKTFAYFLSLVTINQLENGVPVLCRLPIGNVSS